VALASAPEGLFLVLRVGTKSRTISSLLPPRYLVPYLWQVSQTLREAGAWLLLPALREAGAWPLVLALREAGAWLHEEAPDLARSQAGGRRVLPAAPRYSISPALR